MKTNYFFPIYNFNFILMTLVGISLVSCGSFKNSSYEDVDGIYNSSSKRNTTLDENVAYTQVKPNDEYVQKFKEIQKSFEEDVYFTNVDGYVSENDTVVTVARNYADWGSNSQEININYNNYGWNNWGWNNWGWNNWGWNNWYGFGWNNWGFDPWFAGYYGFGWNNWCGIGWNNWYGNPYYGYNVAFNNGRRGMNGNFGNSSGRYVTVEGRNAQIGNSTIRTNTRVRTSPTINTGDTRVSTPNTRTTTSPTRTSSPSRIDTGGSRSSGGSFGGSSSSGGGRSGGGSRGGRG